jgi:hypothetical protein
MPKYTLAGVGFDRIDDIKAHYRKVKAETPLHAPVTDPVILELYTHHPEWGEKSDDTAGLWTDMHSFGGRKPEKQIMLCRPGRESLDISYLAALKVLSSGGAKPDPSRELLNEFRRAARCEIDDQIEPLRVFGQDVDHVAPLTFEVLLSGWLVSCGLRVSHVQVSSTDGQNSYWWFADEVIARSWREYHRQNAKLEAVPKKENLRRGSVKVDWTPLL